MSISEAAKNAFREYFERFADWEGQNVSVEKVERELADQREFQKAQAEAESENSLTFKGMVKAIIREYLNSLEKD